MIGDLLQPTHLLIILIVALLVLGAKRLPSAGRALGQSLREFKGSLTGERIDEGPALTPGSAVSATDDRTTGVTS